MRIFGVPAIPVEAPRTRFTASHPTSETRTLLGAAAGWVEYLGHAGSFHSWRYAGAFIQRQILQSDSIIVVAKPQRRRGIG